MNDRGKTGRKKSRRGSSELTANGYRRVRSDHAREVAEDYVELIDTLIQSSGEARAADLARHLGVTQVTVSMTIKRLKREGLVTSEPYRSIFLTPEGKRLADAARRRHRIVLEFLMALGVPKSDAETDAEGIEHHISPKTLEAMRRFAERDGK